MGAPFGAVTSRGTGHDTAQLSGGLRRRTDEIMGALYYPRPNGVNTRKTPLAASLPNAWVILGQSLNCPDERLKCPPLRLACLSKSLALVAFAATLLPMPLCTRSSFAGLLNPSLPHLHCRQVTLQAGYHTFKVWVSGSYFHMQLVYPGSIRVPRHPQ